MVMKDGRVAPPGNGLRSPSEGNEEGVLWDES